MANEFSVDQTPAEATTEAMILVRQVRTFCANLAVAARGAKVRPSEMASFADKADGVLTRLAELAAVPRVAAEIKAQRGDDTLNVAAIFQQLTAALADARDALAALAEQPVNPAAPEVANAIAKLDAVVAATAKSG